MSTQYRVTWNIDIWADSPEEAAVRAREIQLDPASHASEFGVCRIHHIELQDLIFKVITRFSYPKTSGGFQPWTADRVSYLVAQAEIEPAVLNRHEKAMDMGAAVEVEVFELNDETLEWDFKSCTAERPPGSPPPSSVWTARMLKMAEAQRIQHGEDGT